MMASAARCDRAARGDLLCPALFLAAAADVWGAGGAAHPSLADVVCRPSAAEATEREVHGAYVWFNLWRAMPHPASPHASPLLVLRRFEASAGVEAGTFIYAWRFAEVFSQPSPDAVRELEKERLAPYAAMACDISTFLTARRIYVEALGGTWTAADERRCEEMLAVAAAGGGGAAVRGRGSIDGSYLRVAAYFSALTHHSSLLFPHCASHAIDA